MIFSLEDYPPMRTLQTSICIVGAGAAGISIACELDGSGHDVLLVEAGGMRFDEATTAAIYSGIANRPHPNPAEFREVVFGGTTTVWGGRCAPFDPIDFDDRDYVTGSRWPISYQDVAKYYPRAMNYLDAGKFDFTLSGSAPDAPPTIPGLKDFSVVLGDRIERYSLPTNFSHKYRKKLARSRNVIALLHARCIQINRSPGGGCVESIVAADRRGTRRAIRADYFVLAAGGIEIPRLMMASDPTGRGLGNESDHLGRHYSCHFQNFGGRITAPHGHRLQHDFEKTASGVYFRRRLQFSATAQRENGLLNTAFRFHFPPYSDASHRSPIGSAIYLARPAIPSEYRAILQHGGEPAETSRWSEHLRNVVLGLPDLSKFSLRWLFLHNLSRRKLPYALFTNPDGSYPIEFDSEQTPSASSRITLTRETDSCNLPTVRVDWRLNSQDLDATLRAFRLFRRVINEQSLCRFEFDEESIAQATSESIPAGGHHTGTTRMASSSTNGVVDRNCAVFGLPNLYIASSSVFPTSSHAGPTLTIVALALRLSDHLKAKLRTGPPQVNAESAS